MILSIMPRGILKIRKATTQSTPEDYFIEAMAVFLYMIDRKKGICMVTNGYAPFQINIPNVSISLEATYNYRVQKSCN